ncbi:hypothetical protein B0T25DRAFT_520629 [Lasiosphaeria hispida]|uniref:Uncharacterized protein n=1 Tax=Lasiosphaeria hispida TaxID=260671 RepID=A0AAJ0HAR9_9PEZI|nr:hypothetical protein B0T25DRAFT_520629 [Lasiosphaeria hispida]
MQGSMRIFGPLLSLVALWPGTSEAFRWVNNANFTACYQDIISKLPQNCSDTENQVCLLDDAGKLLNPNRIFVTYRACERLCGDGYGTWDTNDILMRVSLWVIPAIVLIAHYYFPPLGAANITAVVAHILADPIDTLWCLLTRITARRHLLLKAERNRLLSAGAIATIWSVYDELNFHDPSDHFLAALERLQNLQVHVEFPQVWGEEEQGQPRPQVVPRFRPDLLKVDHGRAPDRTGTSKSDQVNRNFIDRSAAFFTSLGRKVSRPPWGAEQPATQKLPEYFQRWNHAINHLQPLERPVLYTIEVAAQRLVFNRGDSALTTWISVFGLLSALMAAFVRTWSSRLETQTSHTIAIVTLLLIVVPIVKLSGNIGAFTSSTSAVNIIQQLRRNLREHLDYGLGPEYDLFPPLNIPVRPDEAPPAITLGSGAGYGGSYAQVPDGESIPLNNWGGDSKQQHHAASVEQAEEQPASGTLRSQLSVEDKQLLDWPKVAAYLGMNNSYRPQKVSNLVPARWSLALLAISFVWVIGLCYIPSLIISYLTPLKGFACRSMAWTVIMFCWLVTAALDHVCAKRWLAQPRTLWRFTCVRDLLVAAFIIVIVSGQQLGLYNSCYCRSGELSRAAMSYVNLTPYTDDEFIEGWTMWVPTPGAAIIVSLVGILIVERFFSESGRLLSRNNTEREKMLLHLRRLAVARDTPAPRPPYEHPAQVVARPEQAAGFSGRKMETWG